MKIAVISDDEKTISQHFGRAPYYIVITIEDGKIINREKREKLGHAHFHKEGHHHHLESGGQHGYGRAADRRHGRMAEAIVDCEAILCRGMGRGAYENMKSRNIRPVVTDIVDVNKAALAYANGTIVDHIDNLH